VLAIALARVPEAITWDEVAVAAAAAAAAEDGAKPGMTAH